MKIVLADDHEAYRRHLRVALEREPDMTVVGEAADGREAIDLARRLAPDIVVMDVMMPEMNGIEATRQIAAAFPAVKVLALSLHDDAQFVEAMRAAGAAGYALKEDTPSALAETLRRVAAGGAWLGPGSSEIRF